MHNVMLLDVCRVILMICLGLAIMKLGINKSSAFKIFLPNRIIKCLWSNARVEIVILTTHMVLDTFMLAVSVRTVMLGNIQVDEYREAIGILTV